MLNDFNKGLAKTTQVYIPTSQTLRQRLEERKRAAEEHLADVCRALAFLDANPTFESLHNLVGKVGY